MPVIGVVGGIGSGKSFVSAALAQLGALVIDADQTGHDVLRQPKVIADLIALFGSSILEHPEPLDEQTPRQIIDRKALGQLVFTDPLARRRLELLVHPAMRDAFAERIEQARGEGFPAVVLDAAVLFEAGWNNLCDRILFVDCPPEVRLLRVQHSRGWSQLMLEQREAAQWPLAQKRERADAVVRNASDDPRSRAELRDELKAIFMHWTESPAQLRRSPARADDDGQDHPREPGPFTRTSGDEPAAPSLPASERSVHNRADTTVSATTPARPGCHEASVGSLHPSGRPR